MCLWKRFNTFLNRKETEADKHQWTRLKNGIASNDEDTDTETVNPLLPSIYEEVVKLQDSLHSHFTHTSHSKSDIKK